MQEGGALDRGPGVRRRNGPRRCGARRGDLNHLAVAPALGDRLARPLPGVGVSESAARSGQIQRHGGKLQRRAALQEQHRELVADVQQTAQRGLGRGDDRHHFRRAVTHLHKRHAGVVPIEHLRGGAFEHGIGQHRRTRAEVVLARHPLSAPSPGVC